MADNLCFSPAMAYSERHLPNYINPLTPELNPSAQRCEIFTGDFAA
jgi:hypothetical protein